MVACRVASVARHWVLAPCAILARYNLEDPLLLGGAPPSDDARDAARELLRDDWKVRNTGAAETKLRFLLAEGHRAGYAAARDGGAATPKQRRFLKQHGAALGDRGLLAWDLGRVASFAGKAMLAGFIAEDAAWRACFDAGRALQRAFSSWEGFGADYLLGRTWWVGAPDRAMHHVFRALVLEPDGPWRVPWDVDLM
jgi:hypothetical protein